MSVVLIVSSEAEIELIEATQALATAFRDIAFVVVHPGDPDGAKHVNMTIAEVIADARIAIAKCRHHENEFHDYRKNERPWKHDIRSNPRNGWSGKNVRSIPIWTPRKYITKRAVVAMRQRKKGD